MNDISRRGLLAGGAAALMLSPAAGTNSAPAGLRYTAVALQTRCDAVNQDPTPEAARARMAASITRIGAQAASARGFLKTFTGSDVRLLLLPEYVLTGFPLGESLAAWREKAALEPDGPEYEALARIAQRLKLYLAGNAYETDRHFPELYFQSTFVIAPSGDTVLRYRRLISLYTPTPYDVWDRYLDRYGYEGVFPVAETEIGVLGGIASEEILYPEIARCLAMRGAEILLHPTSEVGSPLLTQKAVARRARAIENMAYVVSANTAGIIGTPVPSASADAMSTVIRYDGSVMAEAASGESLNANAVLDLPALRAARRRPGMANLLARQPFAAYAPSYADHQHAAPNGRLDEDRVKTLERADILARQRAAIQRLVDKGVIR